MNNPTNASLNPPNPKILVLRGLRTISLRFNPELASPVPEVTKTVGKVTFSFANSGSIPPVDLIFNREIPGYTSSTTINI